MWEKLYSLERLPIQQFIFSLQNNSGSFRTPFLHNEALQNSTGFQEDKKEGSPDAAASDGEADTWENSGELQKSTREEGLS